MKTEFRPSSIDAAEARAVVSSKQRELTIDPEGGLFGLRNLTKALSRAADGDLIILPPGEYPGFELRKSLQIRAESPGTATIKGTVTIHAPHVAMRGIQVRADGDGPALRHERGILILDDCVIRGGLRAGDAGEKSRVFLRDCLVEHSAEGVVLTGQAAAEIHTSRISGCRIGVSLRPGTACALYHSRLEGCVSTDEANPGAGIHAENASLYAQAVTLSRNGVGAYLKNCDEAKFVFSHFSGNEVGALIAAGSPASPLVIRSCLADRQDAQTCAQFSFDGEAIELLHTTVRAAAAPAVAATNARLEVHEARLEAHDHPALEARSCHLSGYGLHCESTGATALAASACQGILHDSRFTGTPPTTLTDSPQLRFESSPAADLAATEESKGGIEGVLQRLQALNCQQPIRNQLERMLRLAHAEQQRRREGLPVTEQKFHSIFMGPPGSGKLTAARGLAEGLFALGVVRSPEVREISPGHPPASNGSHAAGDIPGGVVVIRAADATGSASNVDQIRALIEREIAGNVVVIEGDRNELRQVVRSSQSIGRAFRNTLFFSSFGPTELCAQFASCCRQDHIRLSAEAIRALLLTFHLYCDRKDRRFANTDGVETFYDSARRRYLERCSVAKRVDLEMEPGDFEVPQDRVLRTALEREGAFVSMCPDCKQENPWLAALGARCVCAHCDTTYHADWGIWKGSVLYRQMTTPQEIRGELGAGRQTGLPMRS